MCPETMVLMTNKHLDGLSKSKGIIGEEGTSNLSHSDSLPHPQTVVLKAIGVQCHPSWTN